MAKKNAKRRSTANATKKKAASKRSAPKRGKIPDAKNAAASTSNSKRLSLLDAAAQVMARAKEPMNTREIVEEVLKRKLWTTKGKTPHQTLYSAMLREIQKQGKQARFKRVGRGRFAGAKT